MNAGIDMILSLKWVTEEAGVKANSSDYFGWKAQYFDKMKFNNIGFMLFCHNRNFSYFNCCYEDLFMQTSSSLSKCNIYTEEYYM